MHYIADVYRILEADPNEVVDDILQSLMNKDLVDDHVVRDLALREKTPRDPRTRMRLRQQQVRAGFSRNLRPNSLYAQAQRKQMEPAVVNGRVFTLHESNEKLFTGEFVCWRPVWIGPHG